MIRRSLAVALDAIGEWLVRAGGKFFDGSYRLCPERYDELNQRSKFQWPPDETTKE